MTALAIRELEALREVFLRDSGRFGPSTHLLVIHAAQINPTRLAVPADNAWFQSAVPGQSYPATEHAKVAWPPPHALNMPTKPLRCSAGMLSDGRSWGGGFFLDAQTMERFRGLASSAGRVARHCLHSRPELFRSNSIIEPWCVADECDTWTIIVHQLGWKPLPGSALHWPRHAWDDSRRWVIGQGVKRKLLKRKPKQRHSVKLVNGIPTFIPAKPKEAALPPAPTPPATPKEPNHFFSLANPDLFLASAFAIDAMLEVMKSAALQSVDKSSANGFQPDSAVEIKPTSKAEKRKAKHWYVNEVVGLMVNERCSLQEAADAVSVTVQTIRRAVKHFPTLGEAIKLRRRAERSPKSGAINAQTGLVDGIDDGESA